MKSLKNITKSALYAAAIIAMGSAVTSCDDMLDTKPQGVFTSDQLSSDQVEEFMTAAYASLLNHFFGNNEAFAGPITNWIQDLRSDDALNCGG